MDGGLVKPIVVTLCGSMRFKQAFLDANFNETMAGNIVLSVGGLERDEHFILTEEQQRMLSELHKRKIDISDEIFVLNVGGYIGKSTQSEIKYAQQQGKNVRFLEK